MMRLVFAAIFLLVIIPANAAETLPAANVRFANDRTDDIPDFRRHVTPLLGRLGCNGRECHGSFQGRGGFRLSLFGHDFAADHGALLAEGKQRVDTANPSASLVLQKPSLLTEHEGGKRFERDSWEYRLLKRWIENGASSVSPGALELTTLDVEPKEIVFDRLGQTKPIRVIAHWSDNSQEDVTPLCRFRSNNDSIAAVDANGVIKGVGKGDTHVVVFYDNDITPIPVLIPLSDQVGSRFPQIPTPTKIDELVVAKLRQIGVVPSELCTDAEFLRRVSLDLTGTLPTSAEITAFIADSSADKRQKKIDELLQRPTFSIWLTSRICDVLGCSEENLPIGGEQGVRREKATQWYDWVQRRVAQNVPYDQIVAGIVLAQSRPPEQSLADYFAEMSSYFRSESPGDFAARETMPYFWTRGRFTPPQPLRFSYAFLGVRLECAQCHKHPFDQWTKDDYDGFQAFFEGINNSDGDRRVVQEMKTTLGLTADQDSGGYKKLFADLAAKGTVVPWQEVRVQSLKKRLEQSRRTAKVKGGRVFTPRILGGEDVLDTEYDDPRQPLLDWLRQKDNPYFARTLVNRTWAHFFGVGIVEPPDDMNLANPPSNEPLLQYLALGFLDSGYDLKWLHREIVSSRTYQLSWRPNASNLLDSRNFSHANVRRLPAEVIADAITSATANATHAAAMHEDKQVVRSRAIGVSTGYTKSGSNYMLSLFGKSPRDGVCDCQRSNEPSLLQTVYLRNDAELNSLLDRKDGWLKSLTPNPKSAIAIEPSVAIHDAYLRTFSRPPTEREVTQAKEYISQAENPQTGLRDLMWALLNSKEFLLNH